MSAMTVHIEFVCLRPAHHRLRPTSPCVCRHFGRPAYCPAGEIGGHEWMPASTDLASLVRLGYARPDDVYPPMREENEEATLTPA